MAADVKVSAVVMIVDVKVAGSELEPRESAMKHGFLGLLIFLIKRFIALKGELYCSMRRDGERNLEGSTILSIT